MAGTGPSPAILLATINAKWIHPSLGLRLLKANLGEYEDRAEILEFALRQPLTEKLEPILAAGPRILGLSVSIWNHRATAELLEALEKRRGPENPRPLIILGGPEVSYLPEDAAIFRHTDWVIRGEGELVFRELCAALLEDAIPAVSPPISPGQLPSAESIRGKFIEARPVDTAAIDPGYRLYTGEDLTRKLVYVEASRGCPFGCEFCQAGFRQEKTRRGVPDRRVREFPLEEFLTDMAALIDRGARNFKFLDRTFNLDTDRARRIMEFFLFHIERIRAGEVSAGGPLCVHFEMVPGRFPPELREILTRFPPGSLRLEVGIQTFNPETAGLINRASSPGEELETISFLRRETNAIVHADLIAGLPGEDMASFAAGFDRLHLALGGGGKKPGPGGFEIQLGILKRLPGAPIGRHDGAYRMRYAPEPPYEVLETSVLSAGELDRIKNFARFWELIVNRGAFPEPAAKILPPGEPVFQRFMALSDALLARFGRNWGIDREELRRALEGLIGGEETG